MSDVKWIKITTDVFDDEKILLIESLPEADSIIVIWFKLLCLAGKQNNSGVFMMNNSIAYTDKMLATIFRRKEATVQLALRTFEQFGMVELIDGVITIPNWGKHQNLDQLEHKKQYMKNYMREYREKQKALSCKDNCKTNNKANVSEADKERDKDKEREKDINNSVSKKDISEFFEKVWALYPNKKGKAQVSESKKKTLYEIGIEELTRAIERYKSDLEKEDWRKPQNGSTFFNSGYVDYLDANYTPLEVKPKQNAKGRKEIVPDWAKKNKFNNFEGRNYSPGAMDALTMALIEQPPELSEEYQERVRRLKEEGIGTGL
jgi:predicted phage replisome organizer